MSEKQSQIITFVSAGQFKFYRIWLWFLFSAVGLSLTGWTIYGIYLGKRFPVGIFLYAFVLYTLFRYTRKIKKVEFDEEFLYVWEKDFDIVIPLENIKDVEIKSLDGIYKITLHDPIQSGSELFFKPSLIYPLDFKKQDAKVNVMWQYVEKAKQKPRAFQKNALHS